MQVLPGDGAHSEGIELDAFYPFARSSQLAYWEVKEEIKELSGIDIEMRKEGIFHSLIARQKKRHYVLPFRCLPFNGMRQMK